MPIFNGTANSELIEGSAQNDTIYGLGGNDTLKGFDGNDYIDGGAGNDWINGNKGNDTLLGGAGDDTIKGGQDADLIYGGTGNDEINGNHGIDTIYGQDGNDLLMGGRDSDNIDGGDDNDTLRGNLGDDTLTGRAGNDYLDGDGVNTDSSTDVAIFNGNLNDFSISGLGSQNDVIVTDTNFSDGNEGSDTITHIEKIQFNDGFYEWDGDSWDISTAPPPPPPPPTEDTIGTMDDDHLIGTSGNDSINALGGNDTIEGLGGDDTLQGGTGHDLLEGGDGNDLLEGDLNDTIGNDTLLGGAGNDTLDGGNGVDILDGGDGDDYMIAGNFNGSTGVFVESNGNDTIIGNNANNNYGYSDQVVYGGVYSEYSVSSVVIDPFFDKIQTTIVKSGGTDTLTEVEYLLFNDTAFNKVGISWQEISLTAANFVTDGSTSSDLINGDSMSELLNGNEGNDTINGLGGDDYLYGNDGNDVVSGGDGRDMAIFRGNIADYTITATSVTDNVGDDGVDSISSIETLRFSDGYLYWNGTEYTDVAPIIYTIIGTESSEYIYGTNTDDVIAGLGGNDTIAAGIEDDYVSAGDGDDYVYADDGNDTIYGDDGNDTIQAENGDDLAYGDGGNDYIYGHQGNDTLYGGDGNDTLQGNQGSDSLYGDEGNDFILAEDGNDILEGGLGNDTLNGGSGGDILYGGAGIDHINTGGVDSSLDTIIYENIADSSTSTGVDVIYGFTISEDVIDLSALDISFNELVFSGEILTHSQSDFSIDMQGINTSSLTEDNFIFANTAPVANNDVGGTYTNIPIIINIIANDYDLEDGFVDPNSLNIGNVSHGTLIDNGNGTITYIPDNGFVGSDSFTYNFYDSEGLYSNKATVNLSVKAGGIGQGLSDYNDGVDFNTFAHIESDFAL